jgi:uncharacterized protein YjiS (DUF1127 family)
MMTLSHDAQDKLSFAKRSETAFYARVSTPTEDTMSIASLTQMTNLQHPGILARLAGTVVQWRERHRENAILASLDERDLHDLGLSNADRMRLLETPIWRG